MPPTYPGIIATGCNSRWPIMSDPTIEISHPGVYRLPEDVYHADPVPGGSLSSTGARKLLPPSCPALYRHYLKCGEPPNQAYEFGSAAHTTILGAGPNVTVVEAGSWATKAAKEERAMARSCGEIPILQSDWAHIAGMANEVAGHRHAMELLSAPGEAELSLFWSDQSTGIIRRARLDYLHNNQEIIVDYKTCTSAHPDAIAAAMWKYGYYQKAPWYADAIADLGLLAYWPEVVFIFQEKIPPYLVTVVSPDEELLNLGRERNREAINVYRQCATFDDWPGYTDSPVTVSLPPWVLRRFRNDTTVPW